MTTRPWLVAAALAVCPRVAAADPVIKVGGYVEAFYQLDFNNPSNRVTAYRGFDDRSESFTLGNAVVDVAAQDGDVTTRVALQVGHTPASYYSAEPSAAAQAGVGGSDQTLWRMIQQAYVGYKLGKVQADAGIFLSPIGIETVALKDQWNWSHSNAFTALPSYHSGVRLTYPISDSLTVVGLVTNGWNDIVNRNSYPCFSGFVTWAPSKTFSAQVLYFGGVEDQSGGAAGQPWRHLVDATATWSPTSALTLAGQADAGFEESALGTQRWHDGAGYVRVQASPHAFLTGRVDYLHEHDGGAAPRLFFPAADVASATVTADWRPADTISLRVEYRYDRASAPMFFEGQVPQLVAAGTGTGTTSPVDIATATQQQTLTFGAITWF